MASTLCGLKTRFLAKGLVQGLQAILRLMVSRMFLPLRQPGKFEKMAVRIEFAIFSKSQGHHSDKKRGFEDPGAEDRVSATTGKNTGVF